MRRLRVLTWHVHGSYLYYLTQAPHEFYLPVKPGRPEGYGGRSGSFAWGANVHEVPVEVLAQQPFDVVLFQSRRNYECDQFEVLGAAQRRLPRVYLEHDPPRESPTDTRHPVDDPDVLLVHVTPFNALMWDAGRTPVRVVEHGVVVPDDTTYSGELARGIVVVNDLARRGRRLGRDVFDRVRAHVPLDLAGMDSAALGGLGDLPLRELHARLGRYRFFFNPIRYTSLGLAVCEAMMIGLPILGLATTEMSTAVQSGVNGYVETDLDRLLAHMRRLLADPAEAAELAAGARRIARERFGIGRFAADWSRVLGEVTGCPEGQLVAPDTGCPEDQLIPPIAACPGGQAPEPARRTA
ncbi:glycosyltransferase [Nannocystis sp. ILAH1]|uniref:glycosyltransferase n=1 Tax=Nannocystis sp. ILAH1 TaxID=2996789 RepID=UPI00226F2137|nr:glycosyltransferase [Nannocystis sp. ILAH1]